MCTSALLSPASEVAVGISNWHLKVFFEDRRLLARSLGSQSGPCDARARQHGSVLIFNTVVRENKGQHPGHERAETPDTCHSIADTRPTFHSCSPPNCFISFCFLYDLSCIFIYFKKYIFFALHGLDSMLLCNLLVIKKRMHLFFNVH